MPKNRMTHRSCGRFSWINEGQRSAGAFVGDGDIEGNGDGDIEGDGDGAGRFSRNEERTVHSEEVGGMLGAAGHALGGAIQRRSFTVIQ